MLVIVETSHSETSLVKVIERELVEVVSADFIGEYLVDVVQAVDISTDCLMRDGVASDC